MLESLKIIPLEKIVVFEEASPERSNQLVREIENDGRLKNPLLVLPQKDSYLLLDDAAFIAAMKELQVSEVVVQLAEARRAGVTTWSKFLEKFDINKVIGFCQKYPRQINFKMNPTGGLRPNEAEILLRDNEKIRLAFSSHSYLVKADICLKLCRILTAEGRSYRARLDNLNNNPFADYPEAAAVFSPPHFSLKALAGIARHQQYLPSGLIRINQPGRILGIDYALSILREKDPVSEKEEFLKSLIKLRLSSDRTAYYDGSVYLFNY